jgi:hypothetical protein
MSIVVGNEAGHNDKHRDRLSVSTDEEELPSSSSVDERERNAGRKGVDSGEYGSEDEGEFATEAEVFFEDRGTVQIARLSDSAVLNSSIRSATHLK